LCPTQRNKPYSFGHPSVEAIVSKFLQQDAIPNDILKNPSSNIKDLNKQFEDVMAKLDEILK
jgi:hypothetical protein